MHTVKLLLGFVLLSSSITEASDEEATAGSRLAGLLGARDDAGYEKALEPRRFVFPQDHGPHPGFRNEWWYLTGNLDAKGGRRFGFELTFFRFALTPDMPEDDSNWRSRQVYIAHLAITDVDREKFHVAERFSRGALGLAGAQADPLRVWIDDWQFAAAAEDDSAKWRLQAMGDGFGLDLALAPSKPVVLNGVGGLSQKSAEAGNASYYYSITRLQTVGTLQIGAEAIEVSGLSWLDREWGSSALSGRQEGWDWFALQLSDGSDLMFYNLRRTAGDQDEHSAGTWIRPGGESRRIDRREIEIVVTDRWQSPGGGSYPAGWILRFPPEKLTLKIAPLLDDQELFTTVRYWEGAVEVNGERDGRIVTGRGYIELTGYAD